MKCILLWLIAFVAYFNCYSQKHSYFTINAGPSITTGKLGNKDIRKNGAGLAGIGQALNIGFTNVAVNKFGFVIELRAQRNPLAVKGAEKKLNNSPVVDFELLSGSSDRPHTPQTAYTTYNNWDIRKGSYLSAALVGGVCADLPAFNSDNIVFNAKVLVGGLYLKMPAFDGSASTAASSIRYQESGGSAFGFTYTVGGSLKFLTAKRIFFITGIDFTGTNNINYNDIVAKVTQTRGKAGDGNYQAGMTQITGDGTARFGGINLTAGIGLTL